MAELSAQDRQRVSTGLQRHWSQIFEPMELDKDQLYLAICSTDTWINNNQASYNAALPAAAQSGLTATQKTLLFCVVALARVSIDFLRRVLGEVD